MELTDISTIKSLLARHGFTFSKSLGQNFIVRPDICPRTAELGGARPGTGVIEVGPGIGTLTAELARRAEKVVAVELDKRLLPILGETLADFSNVEIINADILKTDIDEIANTRLAGLDVALCANLPYYITTPVIMRVLETSRRVKSLTVMVQKEASRRLCAEPGTRESGAVSLAVQYYAQPERLFDVPAGCFLPRPKVDSTLIRLTIRQKPPVEANDPAVLFRCIHAAFGQRRKTLLNALSAGLGLPKAAVAAALEAAGTDPGARAETITLAGFAAISDQIRGIGPAGDGPSKNPKKTE